MTEDVDVENLPDYQAVNVPEDKAAPEYTYNERRAELLKLAREKGDPDALHQSQLATRYDVDKSTICRDLKRVVAWIAHNIDQEKARAFSDSAYRKSIRELMDKGEYGKATRALDSWNDWLAREGIRKPEPDKHEVDHSGDLEIEINHEHIGTDEDAADH